MIKPPFAQPLLRYCTRTIIEDLGRLGFLWKLPPNMVHFMGKYYAEIKIHANVKRRFRLHERVSEHLFKTAEQFKRIHYTVLHTDVRNVQ